MGNSPKKLKYIQGVLIEIRIYLEKILLKNGEIGTN
jgi:hypothetical protein